jgi:TonB family protein
MKTNYKNGELDGECTGFYPSGKISGKARYRNGQQLSASFFHEDGSPDDKQTIFYTEAEFPGGPPQWLRFLNKTTRYPEKAYKNNIQGTVIVLFMVTKEGKLKDITVVQSVDPLLDAEAVWVMKKSPDWQPAIIGGLPDDQYKKQPIVFRLQ